MEIEQRLGLYQVFLKLYEHNRGLLDEILQLESTGNKALTGIKPLYVHGVVQDGQVYLITNLIGGKTQMLFQSQHVWMLGRDNRASALTILAKGVSRRHAAIQYIQEQGFYLIDLNSTNGSYVNGEQVYERVLLRDGDRIRLGSVAFTFGICQESQTLGEVSQEFLAQLDTLRGIPEPITLQDPSAADLSLEWDRYSSDNSQETSFFLNEQFSPTQELNSNSHLQFSLNQQSQILDRFFQQQPSHYKDSSNS